MTTKFQSQDHSIAPNIAHFSKIPWCATYLSNPAWTLVPTRCREPKESTEDSLFSTALQTPSTISHHLTLANVPSLPLKRDRVLEWRIASGSKEAADMGLRIPATQTFWSLGADLNGFPNVAHGGLLAALLDEAMGLLLTVNGEFGGGSGALINAVTVFMNVRYRAPVQTPGTVLVGARCTKKEGRKTFVSAQVVQWQEEQGKEVVCAECEGMYLEVKETRL
ncbi:hypothetical protein BT63DRAFT_427740 [Microthyrium microscopicum]|uniref:Thioesterase domain-containing protein n=1 Tax=Microthyrium microscopicum TaxID=703497 RepID=A0A6A6U3V7_9PEZI|nr:hypothetical protein BT63DRAFT_427740 [Microthyrium microscopicum]